MYEIPKETLIDTGVISFITFEFWIALNLEDLTNENAEGEESKMIKLSIGLFLFQDANIYKLWSMPSTTMTSWWFDMNDRRRALHTN